MVEALEYARTMHTDKPSPKPHEITALGYIDRFGVEAVMGRPELSAGEMRRMTAVDNILKAFLSRKVSDDWAKWATDNPEYASILNHVERMDAD